jgi:hypothetical protein
VAFLPEIADSFLVQYNEIAEEHHSGEESPPPRSWIRALWVIYWLDLTKRENLSQIELTEYGR